jgi:hypothetical protein
MRGRGKSIFQFSFREKNFPRLQHWKDCFHLFIGGVGNVYENGKVFMILINAYE